MPFTVEGIGTKYYGKKNHKAYQAQCEFCRRTAQIEEYETRLWFVVVYLPIIPLGRKQILDYCSVCQRHRPIPVAAWEKIKEEAITRATESFAGNPDDPKSAVALLQTLSSFNRFDEAERLAQGIEQRFDDDASVQFQMGQWHEFRNRPAEAEHCYRAALELDPQHAGAKRGVVAAMIAADRPDDAEALARAEPAIWPRQDAALFLELAKAYQRRGQHDEALDLLAESLAAQPRLARDKAFRKVVRDSEKFVPPRDPIIPTVALYRRPWVWAAASLLLVAAAVPGSNAYIANHRTLQLVNGFAVPLDVQIDDEAPLVLDPHSRQEVAIAEGQHRATVSVGGKELRSDQFDVGSGYWSRFVDEPLFVVNAGCGALLMREVVNYSKRHVEKESTTFFANQPFIEFDDVDYPFVEFPEMIELGTGQTATLVRVNKIDTKPEQVFVLSSDMMPLVDQLRFAETHLRVAPDDRSLMQIYVGRAAGFGQLDRVRAFLETGLDAVPVRVEWHRMLQSLATDDAQEQRLTERYAKLLAEDPDNSSLLYLAGRMVRNPDEARSYYERSAAADPTNPYPWGAMGFRSEVDGDFAAAKEAYLKAAELGGDDDEFTERLFDARLALGEFAPLEAEIRASLEQAPLRLDVQTKLLYVLAKQDRLADARAASDAYRQGITESGSVGPLWQRTLSIEQLRLLYLEGNFAEFLNLCDDPSVAEWAAYLRYQGHLESGQYDAAANDLVQYTGTVDGFDALRLCLGWRIAGDEAKADQWLAKALDQLEHGMTEHRHIAKLLRKAPDVSDEELRAIAVDPSQKAALLVALAQQDPERRDSLLALAEKLNYGPDFPHHFIARAIAATRAAQ